MTDIYVDEEESSRMNGRGTKTYANGDVYDGNWKDNKMHGEGKYTCANGAVYDGNWTDDKKHGEGKQTYANGAVYVGNWKDNKKHGEGEYTFANGDVYNGNWMDDERHGEGKQTYANGAVYVGNWKDGKIHGKGKYSYANEDVYVGNWKDDKKHGEGKYTYANGAVYVGNWKDGKIQGKGKYSYATFIDRFGMKCQSTIYNETDKVVHAIVTSRIIETATTNTASANIGGNSLGRAGGTHTNQNIMGPTPPQMSPIPARRNRRFNLDSRDYYLTYYTKDIASGGNVYHEVNRKVKGKNDYVIEPEYLDYEVELAPLLEEEITRLVLPNHA